MGEQIVIPAVRDIIEETGPQIQTAEEPPKKKRGRPPGAKNKPKIPTAPQFKIVDVPAASASEVPQSPAETPPKPFVPGPEPIGETREQIAVRLGAQWTPVVSTALGFGFNKALEQRGLLGVVPAPQDVTYETPSGEKRNVLTELSKNLCTLINYYLPVEAESLPLQCGLNLTVCLAAYQAAINEALAKLDNR